mgnify:CR=1 FL=1|tara:strand:- start:19 stop:1059 length:1041 start_codon:yes stop_codon:yes gene_type:complete
MKEYYKVPLSYEGQDKTDWDEIIEQLDKYAPRPESNEPKVSEGMRFVDRIVLPITQPLRKNSKGESYNDCRIGGDADRDDSLIASFEKGICIREYPPRVVNGKLFAGYGRSPIFEICKYPVWVYDIFEWIEKEDTLLAENAAASDNGRPSSKQMTKSDYVSILVRRIQKNGWDRKRCQKWFDDEIDHNIGKKGTYVYITDAFKEVIASGHVEWYVKPNVDQRLKEFNDKNKLNTLLLNTTAADKGNDQRFMRTLLSSMKQYIDSDGDPVEYVTWMSKPLNGVELDDAEKGLIDKIIPDVVKTIQEFTVILDYKLNRDPSHKPFECSYRLNQKRGEDIDVGNIEPIK